MLFQTTAGAVTYTARIFLLDAKTDTLNEISRFHNQTVFDR